MTSLNPVFTVGQQITEALKIHMGLDKNEAKRAIEMLNLVGFLCRRNGLMSILISFRRNAAAM